MAEHLTIQREGFVQDLLKGESQRTSYKNNYKCDKMTGKNIDEKACRLFANPKVRARYDHLRAKVIEKLEEETIITVKEVLKDYIEIKQACMEKVNVVEFDKETGKYETVATKLVDAQAALKANDSLGKYLNMFIDTVKSENTNKNVNLEVDSIEEADRIIAEFNKKDK